MYVQMEFFFNSQRLLNPTFDPQKFHQKTQSKIRIFFVNQRHQSIFKGYAVVKNKSIWEHLNCTRTYICTYLTSIGREVDIFEMEDKQVIGPLFLIHVLKK